MSVLLTIGFIYGLILLTSLYFMLTGPSSKEERKHNDRSHYPVHISEHGTNKET